MKYYGKITYEIDENHPDVNYVAGGWHQGKVFEYEDTYGFDEAVEVELMKYSTLHCS